MMRILVDADACPVIRLTERIAEEYGLPVILLCDNSHFLFSAYSEVRVIDQGADAVDIALMNMCCKGDIVVTQDYGVAAMVLGKGAYPIHQSGKRYTDDNIDAMLLQRHEAGKARRTNSRHHMKGPRKRTPDDDRCFEEGLRTLIEALRSCDA